MNYLVSVIIPCYNAEKWLVRTLDSALSQSYPHLEIIVVNDGSTDSSLSILEKYKESTTTPFQIVSTKNQGVSHALEIGRTLAKGDFFQYLDSDDILLDKQKIESQVNTLLKEQAEVAFCDYEELYIDGARKASKYAKTLSNRPDVDFIRKFWRPTACFLYTKNIIEKIGAWNSSFKTFNDVRFYLLVSEIKPKYVHIPIVGVLYNVDAQSLSRKYGVITYFTDYYKLLMYFIQRWESQQTLDNERKAEIIEALRDCAKAFIGKDNAKFEMCIRQIYALQPNYIPKKSLKMRLLSNLIGYRQAEKIASYLRKMLYACF
ncbi:glycosyltransferase family 2 protein [Thermoflexibacter ruber]|uniref:Glycosyltransferase involved in cell wall bisynthesis n=1 Tax=Thermoflexibacter ruber TaxID=1003 RepID=A0A1I2IIB1_9BACT|nr:glycosyltransferase [Thermoflexibacter ruber]SFF41400.1 Glycosyltransferase involved in cell wall bisynthesis [Thermoflexibacter ruber]